MDVKPGRQLNLVRIIMIYVRQFEVLCLNEALHYYFFLRNFSDDEGTNLFKICVRDLAVETKEYNKILGTIQPNGIRTKGLIDLFINAEITAESIAKMIGDNLVKKGLFEDAIDVYDIANVSDLMYLLTNLIAFVIIIQFCFS